MKVRRSLNLYLGGSESMDALRSVEEGMLLVVVLPSVNVFLMPKQDSV